MADQKVTALTALAAAADVDLFYVVDDPAGTPISKSITLLALMNSGHVVRFGSSGAYGFRLGNFNGSADTTAQSIFLFDGTTSFPNKIGINNTAPVSGGFANDTGYTAGDADVAAILCGYDNINNALAAIIAGQHSMIMSGATHSGIFAGSTQLIKSNSDYALIAGGINHILGTGSDYSVLVGGEGNEGADGINRIVGIGGAGNSLEAQYAAALSGSSTTVDGTRATAINGASCTVSGLHAVAAGASNNVTGNYNFVQGNSNTTSGSYNLAVGNNCTVAYDFSLCFGDGCVPATHGFQTFSGRQRANTAGNNQAVDFNCSNETTSNETKYLSTYGSTNYPAIPENCVVSGTFYVIGVDLGTGASGTAGDTCVYEISNVAVKRGSGSTAAAVGSSTVTEISDGITVTDPSVNVNSSGFYRVQVNGVTDKNIAWNARFVGHQIKFA